MKCHMLIMAAVAAIMVPMTAPAQATEIHGEVVYEDGRAIPEGQIEIYLEDSATQDNAQRHASETLIKSDGGSKMIVFSFSPEAHWDPTSPTLQIIARLERADGWLLARGSTKLEPGSSVFITLNTAMY